MCGQWLSAFDGETLLCRVNHAIAPQGSVSFVLPRDSFSGRLVGGAGTFRLPLAAVGARIVANGRLRPLRRAGRPGLHAEPRDADRPGRLIRSALDVVLDLVADGCTKSPLLPRENGTLIIT